MDELGYVRRPRRDPRAAPLLVDIVLPRLAEAWVGEFLQGAQAVARRLGAQIVLSDLGDGDWCEPLATRSSAGVVLGMAQPHQARLDWLASKRIPCVSVALEVLAPGQIPAVVAAGRSGARQAVEHLLGLGHRRVAVLVGQHTNPHVSEQVAGVAEAMRAAGAATRAEYLRDGTSDFTSAVSSMHELLDLSDPPTAVFAGSAELAGGAVVAAAARGLGVPEDLSIVGFGGLDAPGLPPHLTSVRLPVADMAAAAVGMLLSEGPYPVQHLKELPAQLVVRNSTAAPPRDVTRRKGGHNLRQADAGEQRPSSYRPRTGERQELRA